MFLVLSLLMSLEKVIHEKDLREFCEKQLVYNAMKTYFKTWADI